MRDRHAPATGTCRKRQQLGSRRTGAFFLLSGTSRYIHPATCYRATGATRPSLITADPAHLGDPTAQAVTPDVYFMRMNGFKTRKA